MAASWPTVENYCIGVTIGNMQELTDLGLPEPLYQPISGYTPFSGARTRMDGLVVGTGRPVITWAFNELTIPQMGVLLYYVEDGGVLQASQVVYIRTRVNRANMTGREWGNFTAFMMNPMEPEMATYDRHRKFTNVTVTFARCVEGT